MKLQKTQFGDRLRFFIPKLAVNSKFGYWIHSYYLLFYKKKLPGRGVNNRQHRVL